MFITTIYFRAFDRNETEVLLTEAPPTQAQIKAKVRVICNTAFPKRVIIQAAEVSEYLIYEYDNEGNPIKIEPKKE